MKKLNLFKNPRFRYGSVSTLILCLLLAAPACAEELRDVLKSTYLQGLAEGKFESAEDAAAKFWAEAQEIWKKYE